MIREQRSFHENGTLRADGNLVNGSPHGLHREWHSNGVLAKETPYAYGLIDGTVRQWNAEGELIAESELPGGTGVLRSFYPEQGLNDEMTFVKGKLTGRQRCHCGGELMATVYWLENEKVSKKRYLEACKQNPNLPRYEDELRTRAKNPMLKKTVKFPSGLSQPRDELPLKLLKGPRVREALSWLEESRQPSRSVSEATGQDESIRLVKKLYGLGAVAVHAVEIDGEPAEEQNTGRIVIELSQDQEKRRELLKFCGKLARKEGFDPDPDVGQRYMLLMLD